MHKNKHIAQLPEVDLVRRYKESGDMLCFEELYNRYHHLVFGVCLKYLRNREDAKDSLTTIFIELVTKLKQYDVEHFQSWLHAVCRNHCLSRLKRESGSYAGGKDFMISDNSEEEADAMYDTDNLLAALEKAVDELSEHQRLCIRLFYLEQKSYRQIAEQTSLTMADVKTHIQNGKRNLKLRITKRA